MRTRGAGRARAGIWTRARWRIEGATARAIERLARALPPRAVPRAGAILGAIAHACDARHRRVAIENLTRAHGDRLSRDQARAIVRDAFAHFGRVAVEMLRLGALAPDTIGGLAETEGLEHLRAAAARGRGVIICAAHFGNWELHAVLQGWMGFPLALVTRPMDNPAIERQIARLRGVSGNTVVDKRRSLRPVLRALRRGGVIGVLIDQRPRHGGLVAPFFGRPARTSPAVALLALRTGAAVVPAYSIPRPDGTYRLVYEPEIPVVRTGDIDADVFRLTAQCTGVVERWVRDHPALWLWMHDRWR